VKRSTVLKLIAPILQSRNTSHYSYDTLVHADLILKQLEDLNLIKPTHKKVVERMCMMGTPYDDYVTVEGWQNEEE
jgi:hypothetical protein